MVSLFTNVPLKQTIQILVDKAFIDDWFNKTQHGMKLKRHQLAELLEVAMTDGMILEFYKRFVDDAFSKYQTLLPQQVFLQSKMIYIPTLALLSVDNKIPFVGMEIRRDRSKVVTKCIENQSTLVYFYISMQSCR